MTHPVRGRAVAMLLAAALLGALAWALVVRRGGSNMSPNAEPASRPATRPLPLARPGLPVYRRGERVARLANPGIRESSGVAVSRLREGVWWTHNDSGGQPRVYAFDLAGADLGSVVIQGASNYDWEDMASYRLRGRAYLLLADVGDYFRQRHDCRLYVVPEPASTVPGRMEAIRAEMTIEFTYEDGPRDCEAVAVDPTEPAIYLIQKAPGGPAGVYRLPLPRVQPAETLTARRIASVPLALVTGMDISPDGGRAVVCTYLDGFEFTRAPGGTWEEAFASQPRRISLPLRIQGEAIGYGTDGRTLVLTAEGRASPVWIVPAEDPAASEADAEVAE